MNNKAILVTRQRRKEHGPPFRSIEATPTRPPGCSLAVWSTQRQAGSELFFAGPAAAVRGRAQPTVSWAIMVAVRPGPGDHLISAQIAA